MIEASHAPGWPGSSPRWTSSAKSGVGTAINPISRVWFTLSHGILNEIYYPRVDMACTRDMGLMVSDGQTFVSEEKRHTAGQVSYMEEGALAYRLVNTCFQGRYLIEKEVITDPHRDVLLQRTRFTALKGNPDDYHLYVVLAPHLGNRGAENTGWVGDYKGVPMLFAERDGCALALACSSPWALRSVGFVGVSDGWQDVTHHRRMEWLYERAEKGNIALTGEINLSRDEFVLALGFGSSVAEAGQNARTSLLDGFPAALRDYIQQWTDWQRTVYPLSESCLQEKDLYRVSMAVLRAHEAAGFPGGIIASLSIPWGFQNGDEDLGGYHLVWPRDLVEAVVGMLAGGAGGDALRVLRYLQATQEADGHWPQNMWLDGTPYWNGLQLDEAAFPILLVDLALRNGLLAPEEVAGLYPMVRKAVGFLVQNGPVTQQDRWEEDPGYSPFTLAVETAALLVAAGLSKQAEEPEVAQYLTETADAWNDHIERWIYVEDTDLARQVGVKGYYVRIAPPESAEAASPSKGFVPIKNRPPEKSEQPAECIVSPDALALVRFGLRAPDDPRILDTVKVIDALLKAETPYGPTWHRYSGDGYGEHEDGSPFDGTGIGRGWPLLVGERAHYELALGNREEAEKLMKAMAAFANEGGMIPEQTWDAPDIPERELFKGRPAGSAMPLVWAHAEYIKLRRSLRDDRVFDLPLQTVQRYIVEKRVASHAFWRFNHKCRTIRAGQFLRIETLAPALVHWSDDHWRTLRDTPTHDTGLGMHIADLPVQALRPGDAVSFTFYWPDAAKWEGTDFSVGVV